MATRAYGGGHGFAEFLEIAVTLRTLFRDQELKRLVELLGVFESGRDGHLHRDLVVHTPGLLAERVVHLVDHRIFHGIQELEIFADGHVERRHAIGEVEQDLQKLQEGFPFLLASHLAGDVGGVPLEQRHGLPRDHQHQLAHDPGFALEFGRESFLRSARGAGRPVGEAGAARRAGDLEDLAGGNAELLPALGVHAGDDLGGIGGLHHAVPRPDVFPSSFDNCSTNFAPTMAVTRFMCSESSSHSAGIRSFLSCGWIPHLALTVSPSRMTSTLINWTEQGIRNAKDSRKRLDAVKKQLKELGGELKAFYMTQGTYDALLIYEIPNDTVLAKLLLQVGSAGNVRTTTVRAYTEAEYREIMAGLR